MANTIVYLSELTLDARSRRVLGLLGDSYAMHRALAYAFPDRQEDGSGGIGRMLYRVESQRGGVKVLVQSHCLPNWSRLDLLNDPARVRGPKALELRDADGAPLLRQGQVLRFRLRANPTVKRNGKRHALWELAGDHETDEERDSRRHRNRAVLDVWLRRKGEQHGFALVPSPTGDGWIDPFGLEELRVETRAADAGRFRGAKPHTGSPIVHRGVDFDGLLQVTDSERLVEAVESGIGSAKGFGFGLLSLARA